MKTGRSILYLFVFLLISSSIFWFYYILPISVFKNIQNNALNWADTVLISLYPENLIISAKDGFISLNRPTPYCFLVDKNNQSGIVFTGDKDPKASSLTNNTYSFLCKPLALIGDNYYIYTSRQNVYNVEIIPSTVNFNLDKNKIIEFTNRYLPLFLKNSNKAYYIFPFITITPLLLIGFLCQNLWYSWVAKIIIKTFKLHSEKKLNVYGTSLFLYTVILFIDWVVVGLFLNNILNQNIYFSFPFFNTMVIGISTALMVKPDIQSQPDNGHSRLPPVV